MFELKQGMAIVGYLTILASSAGAFQPAKKPARPNLGGGATVLVRVNGDTITEADLNRSFAFVNVPEGERPRVRDKFIENLIDNRLIQQFLKTRKTAATSQEIDEQIKLIKTQMKQARLDPDKVLEEKGFTNELLREMFAVPLGWKRYTDRILTSERLKKYFAEHRAEFDGTKVQARQILIKAPAGDEAARDAAEATLGDLRKQILARKIAFEDAAREHSDVPSKEQGGDVGYFPYAGKMPQKFSQEAFRLKVGEISQPFRSGYGVHLVQVTDRKPGDLSLEDVRGDVLTRMRDELWKETTTELRDTAKIERMTEKP